MIQNICKYTLRNACDVAQASPVTRSSVQPKTVVNLSTMDLARWNLTLS